MSATCGKCRTEGLEAANKTVNHVRAHYAGLAFSCTWLYEDGYDEDGQVIVTDCRADAVETATGWECEAGHDYVNMETRYRQGWDYAHDEEEAKILRKYGTEAVAMNGGSI